MKKRMATKEMKTVYLSEVYGESAFRSAFILSSGNKKRKADLLWRLEKQTKEKVIKYYEHENMVLPLSAFSVMKGSVIGFVFPFFPWSLVMNIILLETKEYLALFERLEMESDESNKIFFKYLVDHEMAIRTFAQKELEKKPKEAEQVIIDLLSS